ncbi:Mss4-like protein [Xylariomycetidae sp. FL2044]|nr:Mss4-like protein [Xylariomycetidae sp. FL2044]
MTSSPSRPLTVRCQCGSITFPTPTPKPITLFHCHCTECQKQSASAFGTSAIFRAEGLFPLSAELEAAGRLKLYSRAIDDDQGGRRTMMDCYFCGTCGSRVFHRIRDADGTPRPTVSIKGGCVEGLDWSGGKHIFVRSAVMKIPEGWETYDTVPDSMK